MRAAFDEGIDGSVYFNSGRPTRATTAASPSSRRTSRPSAGTSTTLVAAQVHPPGERSRGSTAPTRWASTPSATTSRCSTRTILRRRCVGRAHYIGRERYLEGLARAAGHLPRRHRVERPRDRPRADRVDHGGDRRARGARRRPGRRALRRATSRPRSRRRSGDGARAPRPAPSERQLRVGWVRDLARGITPARGAAVRRPTRPRRSVWSLTRWRLGALAARNLARFRRRLRVRPSATHSTRRTPKVDPRLVLGRGGARVWRWWHVADGMPRRLKPARQCGCA